MAILLWAAALVAAALGVVVLWTRYRIVAGGTLVEAEVVDFGPPLKSQHPLVVAFQWEGQLLRRPAINATARPQSWQGRQVMVYYNPRRPESVALKSRGLNLLGAGLVLLGVLLALVPVWVPLSG